MANVANGQIRFADQRSIANYLKDALQNGSLTPLEESLNKAKCSIGGNLRIDVYFHNLSKRRKLKHRRR